MLFFEIIFCVVICGAEFDDRSNRDKMSSLMVRFENLVFNPTSGKLISDLKIRVGIRKTSKIGLSKIFFNFQY